jgi:hypothetical protein
MHINVIRNPSRDGATTGELFIDGAFFCHTLEDEVREVEGLPVKDWKVYGETAIPRGTYKLLVTHSTRFNCDMPLISDVPGYAGCRIHTGNKKEDTEGCLLVGFGEGQSTISRSRDAFNELFPKIKDAIAEGETVTITFA